MRGRTPGHRPTVKRQPGGRRYGPAIGPAQPRRSTRRNAQEWRATETVVCHRGMAQPYGPPGRRSSSLPVQLPHLGEHGAAWVIRHVPVNRAWVPKAHPAIGDSRTRRAANRLRSIEPGQAPGDIARLRGSWPGPDCDGSSVPGPLASPVGWAVSPPGLTGQPKHASYPAGAPGKQADAPGRGSDRGRSRRPWRVAPEEALTGCQPLRRGVR